MQVPVVGTVMCATFFSVCVPGAVFIVPRSDSSVRMLFQYPLGFMRA